MLYDDVDREFWLLFQRVCLQYRSVLTLWSQALAGGGDVQGFMLFSKAGKTVKPGDWTVMIGVKGLPN